MIATQVIRNCLEQLQAITRMEFCVQDTEGIQIAATKGMDVPRAEDAAVFARSLADSQTMGNRCLLKVCEEGEPVYVLTVMGESDHTLMVGRIAAGELEQLLLAYREKYDRSSFFQNLLMDNLLPVDIHNRAKKLHINVSGPRAIILFEVQPQKDTIASELLGGLFEAQNGDYLTEIDENHMILIKSLPEREPEKELVEAVQTAVDMLNMEAMIKVRAAYGTIVGELGELSRSYKEARMALNVGRLFYAQNRILSYEKLGMGRLIYQLPESLCRIFLTEVLGSDEPVEFDREVLTTIHTFLENNLNVSETARKLYLHRNTLVYRIEKLQKSTGLDIRRFEDAMTLWIALMVSAYLRDPERQNR